MPYHKTLTQQKRWDYRKRYIRKDARTAALRLVYGQEVRTPPLRRRGKTIVSRNIVEQLVSGDDMRLHELFKLAEWPEQRQTQIAADFHRRYRIEVERRTDVPGRTA